MQALTATLTSAVMLVHALVGCSCQFAEHALSCGEDCVTASDCDHCCCHHNSSDKDHAPATPCKCHIECRSVCIGLPREKSLAATQVVAPFDLVITEVVAVNAHTVVTLDWERNSAAHSLQPPLRLHLLHQLLLI
jgi:hypothetical protein